MTNHKSSILVVDDSPVNLELLCILLQDRYRVSVAQSGMAALEMLESGAPADLILLDVMMPEMDGYQVLARLGEMPQARGIPVIIITALSDLENELKGLQAGAVDYITKPFTPAIVHARVATHLALRQARKALEQRNESLLRERLLVEEIIMRMRGSRFFDERQLRYLMSPVERSNGDILLASFTPDGRQWLLVGDFTGHGLPAALSAPLVAHVFYRGAAEDSELAMVLQMINDTLYEQLPIEIFMAATVIEVAADRHQARFWSAGMPEALLFDAAGRCRMTLSATAMPPFGILPHFDFGASYLSLSVTPGERLYVFSDGAPETTSPDGKLFDLKGMKDFLAGLDEDTPLDRLINVLTDYHGAANFHDDITLAEIRL